MKAIFRVLRSGRRLPQDDVCASQRILDNPKLETYNDSEAVPDDGQLGCMLVNNGASSVPLNSMPELDSSETNFENRPKIGIHLPGC